MSKKYIYNNRPITEAQTLDGARLAVIGSNIKDDEIVGGGVLEWCANTAEAERNVRLMRDDPSIGNPTLVWWGPEGVVPC